MRLFVSLLPSLRPVAPTADVAVVIDVLRATSVMATALANGAASIATCEEIDDANMIAEMIRKKKPLLCGERACQKIPGFDLGNSPAEYVADVVQEKTLVLTTTNGTHAIAAAGPADRLITASFLNLHAVVELIKDMSHVHLVCAGTEGEVTAEDTLMAGAIVHGLQAARSIDCVGDEPFLAAQLWRASFGSNLDVDADSLAEQLANSHGGRNLIQAGYSADLKHCALLDAANVVPERVATSPSTFALKANEA
jgi:2-phosphosulfolactate phosphatase